MNVWWPPCRCPHEFSCNGQSHAAHNLCVHVQASHILPLHVISASIGCSLAISFNAMLAHHPSWLSSTFLSNLHFKTAVMMPKGVLCEIEMLLFWTAAGRIWAPHPFLVQTLCWDQSFSWLDSSSIICHPGERRLWRVKVTESLIRSNTQRWDYLHWIAPTMKLGIIYIIEHFADSLVYSALN